MSPHAAPLVSVITIFRDEERFIAEAIESVRAQTYDNWELLLVDDGSTDRSTAIAREYAGRDPSRVRYLEHPGHVNRGMSASRNLGLVHAQGTYIALLDADDIYLPPKLERQVSILERFPAAAMAYGPTLVWHSWKGPGAKPDYHRTLGVAPDTLVQPPELARLYLERRAQTPGTCGVLMRRSALTRVGGWEDSFRGMFEDAALFSKLALESPIYVSGEAHDRYRQRSDSTVRQAWRRGGYYADRPDPHYARFLEWLDEYLGRRALGDRSLRRRVRRELWWQRHPPALRLKRIYRRLAS